MRMSNKTYNAIKCVAQIALPAAGTLYFALAEIWNFPYAEEIMGSIAAVDTCLGTMLHLMPAKYCKDCEEGQ